MVDGIRATFLLSGAAVIVTAVLGTLLGVAAGYLGGWVDALVARGADVIFELAQHHGDRRGRAGQILGGIGKGAMFGHRPEAAQHFDFDGQNSESLEPDACIATLA